MGVSLSIQLLGQFALRQDDRAQVPLESGRAESLLTYLLLNRGVPQPRPRVAFLLWPESTETQALTNLRHVLHYLRRSWPPFDTHVQVTSRTLCWSKDQPFRLDVDVFENALATETWEAAVGAYGGDLLAGVTDEWVLEERARLRRRYLDALERLVLDSEETGDLARAVHHAERLLREEPLRERTYLALMRLHDARGDRARAVRVYHECAATLETELGVEPAATTRAAYAALLARDDTAEAHADRIGGPPLVARAPERAALAASWRRAQDGGAHVVLLTGEAGIGKTRLAEEFRAWCAHRGAVTAVGRAYPSEGALAYGPVAAWLRSASLRPYLSGLEPSYLTELGRVLPELLSTVPGLTPPQPLPESEQRARLYDAVVCALTAPGAPLLLVSDDLQWWDRESLQLLHYLVRTQHPIPLLVVATARREDTEADGPAPHLVAALRAAGALTEVELPRLDRSETALLAARLGSAALTDAEAIALYEQTAGNPLFVVETLRAGLGGGTLPPKIQAVIESRLGQLSVGARELVDVAATIGREFAAELLSSVVQWDEATVVRGLDELWRRRIIRESSEATYDFSHDRISEVAYAELSPMRRRHLHRSVARALAERYSEDPTALGGRLAHHLEEAGATAQAVVAYARAAEVAQQVYAHSEAVRLINRALALLDTLPRTTERSRLELELSTALMAPLVASEGYSSPRIHDAHQRALTTAASLGAEPAPPLLRSLGLARLASGDFAGARGCGLALLERGERSDDDVLRVEGNYLLGVAAFWAGELVEATHHLEAAVTSFREENRRVHLLRYAQDPKAICLTRLALAHWLLGDREAAIAARDEGLAVAEEVGHPYSVTVSLLFASLLALDMGDLVALRRFVDRAKLTTPEDDAFGFQVEDAVVALDAFLDAAANGSDDGIATIQRILAETPAAQAAPGLRSSLLRILLAACEVAGADEVGLAAADELLTLTNSVIWKPAAERFRARFPIRPRPANA